MSFRWKKMEAGPEGDRPAERWGASLTAMDQAKV